VLEHDWSTTEAILLASVRELFRREQNGMFSSVESRQPIIDVCAQDLSGELGLSTQGRRAVLYFVFTSLVSSATRKETFDSMGRLHQTFSRDCPQYISKTR
jgi:hypothetical protein